MTAERKMITVIDADGREHRTLDLSGYSYVPEPGWEPEGYDGNPIPWETVLARGGLTVAEHQPAGATDVKEQETVLMPPVSRLG